MNKKSFIILLAALFLTSCGSNVLSDSIKNDSSSINYGEPSIFNENYIHYFGRHEIKDKEYVYFSYSASGFEVELNFTNESNSVDVNLISGLSGYDTQYLNVFVDDTELDKIAVSSGEKTIRLINNLSSGKHVLKVLKSNEVIISTIKLLDMTLEGCEMLPYSKVFEKRIEVYGDSITCGYGNLTDNTHGFSTETEDAYYSYGVQTAETLGYDYSIVSRSGISLAMNAFNSDYYFKHLYPTVDGTKGFGIDNYQVDYAIVNLGTNDNTKFNTYSSSEQQTKVEEYYQAYLDLVLKIKDSNPQCIFLLCYNMMTNFNGYLETAIQGVSNYLNDNYDESAYMLKFTPDYHGADGHPSKAAHLENAQIISDFIKENF